MSINCPVTYLIECENMIEEIRRCYFSELADNGGKHIVLSSGMLNNIVKSPNLLKVYLNEVEQAGLSFVDAHAPYNRTLDLHNADDIDFDQMIMRYKLYMRIAASMNISTITFHTGGRNLVMHWSAAEHRERVYRSLDGILPEAEDLNIVVALENSWSYSNRADALLEIKERYPSDNLGFCFDSGHANIVNNGRLHTTGTAYDRWGTEGFEVPQWDDQIQEKMLEYTVNCHLHDNDGSADSHLLPGMGNVDWKKTVGLLRKTPRLQAIQCEVKHLRHTIAIKDMVKTFEQLFADN